LDRGLTHNPFKLRSLSADLGMWSAVRPVPVHLRDTFVETSDLRQPILNVGTFAGDQLNKPYHVPLVESPIGSTAKYRPGELLVRSANLGDHDEKSECSTTDGALTPTDEPAHGPSDSVSGDMFLPLQTPFSMTSGPCQFTSTVFPTLGSAGHFSGQCKPCAFVNTKGCKSGYECKFCHLCAPGEKKRRKREKGVYYNYMKTIKDILAG